MSEVKRYHVVSGRLCEGVPLGMIGVVLVADFDRVTAERDALLDAPAEKNWEYFHNAMESERDYWKALAHKPAAPPQGEPIYQLEYLGEGEGEGGWNDVEKATYDRFERLPNYRPRIVYAEQPAPVAEYDALFIAIGDAVTVKSMGHISISVKAFKERMLRCGLAITSAEQPAPVAVVLPERLPGDDGVCTESHYASGWNTCIDEFGRLNPSL